MKFKARGFTLVELSIVIVIIGLIVSGVVAGNKLVHQAKLKSVISESRKFELAINSFQLEYNALPGDMNNAQSYWGLTVSNGDGDGYIGDHQISSPEQIAAFEHLSRASLIEGSYDGVAPAEIGRSIPNNPYSSDTTFYFYGGDLWSNFVRGHSLIISGSNNFGWNDYKLSVKDAHAMDNKMDDGKPYLGKILTMSDIDGNCVPTGQRLRTNPTLSSVDYQLTNLTDKCTIHFGLNYVFK